MTEAALFYDENVSGLGTDFIDDVQRAVDRLRNYPTLGRVVTGDLRRILLSRFPFCIIYSIEPEGLLIVAVAHQYRRPGYWRERIT